MPRLVTRAVAPVLALAIAACLAAIAGAPARAADVHGDDEHDRYVGTGGLVLPGSVDGPTRQEVAGCPDCEWRLAEPCRQPEWGNGFDGPQPCLSVTRGCAGMAELLRAWWRPEGEGWREVGLVCIGPVGPTTVPELTALVRDVLVAALPPLVVERQPARGAVTQLPLAVWTRQPADGVTVADVLDGLPVTVRAQARWTWTFGDGAGITVATPGAPWPAGPVQHAYRVAGRYRLAVEARWSASFSVAGLGPFPVAEPVTQAASSVVEIGEGRALLTRAAGP